MPLRGGGGEPARDLARLPARFACRRIGQLARVPELIGVPRRLRQVGS
jgi:hypothetical protein